MTRPSKQIDQRAGRNINAKKETLMQTLKYLTLALLLATLASTSTFAKPGHGGDSCEIGKQPPRLEHLRESLGLTTQQEAEIKEILAATQDGKQNLRREQIKTREEIQHITRAESLDEPHLRELLHRQSEQRADTIVARHATRVRIDQVLTPEQREQHKVFRQQREAHRGAKHGQAWP